MVGMSFKFQNLPTNMTSKHLGVKHEIKRVLSTSMSSYRLGLERMGLIFETHRGSYENITWARYESIRFNTGSD